MRSDDDVLYVPDVLDQIEAEIASSPVVPVSGQIALDPARMAVLIERLRGAAADAETLAGDEARHREAVRRAEAEAALVVEEARRKAETMLDGSRVSRLREEHVQAIIGESRQAGEALITAAYEYGLVRMLEVQARAEDARRLVSDACEKVEAPGGGLTKVARGVGRGLFGSLLGRRKPPAG